MRHSRNKRQCYLIVFQGKQYIGTAEDVARWYCQQSGIKLYIEPEMDAEGLYLYASFDNAKELTLIACFEDDGTDLESGYKLFFTKYMQGVEDPDFTVEPMSLSFDFDEEPPEDEEELRYWKLGKAFAICMQYPDVFNSVTMDRFCGMFFDDPEAERQKEAMRNGQ